MASPLDSTVNRDPSQVILLSVPGAVATALGCAEGRSETDCVGAVAGMAAGAGVCAPRTGAQRRKSVIAVNRIAIPPVRRFAGPPGSHGGFNNVCTRLATTAWDCRC